MDAAVRSSQPVGAHRPAAQAHSLPNDLLDAHSGLMAFNWMVAEYAHADWLGAWAKILSPQGVGHGARAVNRASDAMLERFKLKHRFLRHPTAFPWLLWKDAQLHGLCRELGVAMLGGWVRNDLERESVAAQLRILTPDERSRAMQYAVSLRSLPFWECDTLAASSPDALLPLRLGASCLAALLLDRSSGARERFTMRFAKGTVQALVLTQGQSQDAWQLIRAHRPAGPAQGSLGRPAGAEEPSA